MIDLVYLNELRRYENTLKRYDLANSNKINKYKFQSDVLDKDIPSLLRSVQRKEYEFLKRDLIVDFSLRNWLAEQFGCCEILEAYRMNESYKKRIQRLKSKIQNIFISSGNVYFLTFTFRDECFDKFNDLTRRRYVQRWLNQNTNDFVANIDYGEKYEREHYHAVVSADKIDTSDWFNKCGALNFEKVRLSDKSNLRLSKYINKLVNHAVKESTKRNHIIYKRLNRRVD